MATTTRTAKDATEAAEATAKDVANTVENATAKAAEKVEALTAEAQKNVSEQIEKFSKGIEGLTAFSQENVDAFVKSSEIAAKAAEGIGSELSAYSKKVFEDGVAAAQEFASAKTMTELFEKQTAYAQSTLEGLMQQTTKMNEIYSAAAKDISAPIGARVTAATEQLKSFSL
ncbi:phasin family protein [Amaricoccus sp. W119]|uniref:phasin family protein n=1 Tax=Amaricoccus sp. W119 TaxID=3391833 RepID=UPI0039A41BE6